MYDTYKCIMLYVLFSPHDVFCLGGDGERCMFILYAYCTRRSPSGGERPGTEGGKTRSDEERYTKRFVSILRAFDGLCFRNG